MIDEKNREREISGLLAAMDRWKIDSGMIITYNQDEELESSGSRIVRLIPAWKWLLENLPTSIQS
jgi:hypothetical protein